MSIRGSRHWFLAVGLWLSCMSSARAVQDGPMVSGMSTPVVPGGILVGDENPPRDVSSVMDSNRRADGDSSKSAGGARGDDDECKEDKDCRDGNPCTSGKCDDGKCAHINNQNSCNDGNGCTTNDRCRDGVCSGQPRDCDDDDECTQDSCHNGSCRHTEISGCDDKCGHDSECLDGNPCTGDKCVNGDCVHINNQNSCNDNNGCTTNDRCRNGVCGGQPRACSDGDDCTSDTCENGACRHTPIADCECNEDSDCADGNPCTGDKCDDGRCHHTNNQNSCNDNNACTTNDRCRDGACSGQPRNCGDDDECTQDSCHNGACQHTPIPGCADECDHDSDCTDGNPCTSGKCDDGKCVHVNNQNSCNDNNGCTVNDRCQGGTCTGQPRNCSDGDGCTQDSCQNGACRNTPIADCKCDEDSDCKDDNPCTSDKCDDGECRYTNNNHTCNDGNNCTTDDRCTGGVCRGTPVVCKDDDECTNDVCQNGACRYTPIPNCECDEDKDCADDNPCTSDKCDDGECRYTNNNHTCNDANNCTMNDRCTGGVCRGTPIVCKDDDECTNDVCENGACRHIRLPDCECDEDSDCADDNPCTSDKCVNGDCRYTNNNNSCNDANNCTTNDRCLGGLCRGTPIVCNDGDGCTNDVCENGTCRHHPIPECECDEDSDCFDGNPCTSEKCDDGICRYQNNTFSCNDNNGCTTSDRCREGICDGQPRNCFDNDDCTTDSCENHECRHTPIPGCGNECDEDSDCEEGNPCTTDKCSNGDCIRIKNQNPCNDDDNCTTNDRCFGGDCVGVPRNCGDGDECTVDRCQSGACVHDPIPGCGAECKEDSDCNDSNSCTRDRCINDQCVHTPIDCGDDGNPCTAGRCVPGIGCVSFCDDEEAPSITCPASIVIRCAGPGGIPGGSIDFEVTAEDNCDEDVAITDNRPIGFPPSCSGLPTSVDFVATDDCGNSASCSVGVAIAGPLCCPCITDTDLVLLPIDLDLRQDTDGPRTTKAKFDIWNEMEARFSGTHYCVTCWDETLLSRVGLPNHFLRDNLHTDKGKARVDGESSPSVCDRPGVISQAGPILGVAVKRLQCGGPVEMRSAMNLVGVGEQAAQILYDIISGPDSARRGMEAPPASGISIASIPVATGNGGPDKRASSTQKGSLIFWPLVEIKWNARGQLIQDTVLDLTNDNSDYVQVQLYLVNGDEPLAAVVDGNPPVILERAHPGWNNVDVQFGLTANQPTYWSAATGLPTGVSPFPALDPGAPPGRPDADPSNPGGRVLRGFVVGWAVDSAGHEIRWNHLKGDAVLINYAETTAWEYNAWSFRCVSGADTGEACDATPGQLNLDGVEYDSGPDHLLLDFIAAGSEALSHPSMR